MRSLLRVSLSAGVLAILSASAFAQFPPPPPSGSPMQDRWPTPQEALGQLPPEPAKTAPPAADPKPPAADPKPRAAVSSATVVACGGVFAKNTTHERLAGRYEAKNIFHGDVAGPDGSQVKASVLYPNEPKRRLEVVWANDEARRDVQLIAITGQSQWAAPKGLKLGLAIASLEKTNGKPFRMSGFAADGTAKVVSWDGGALSRLPGGCQVGIRLVADPNVAPGNPDAAGEKEQMSNDPGLRQARPRVAEILIGY